MMQNENARRLIDVRNHIESPMKRSLYRLVEQPIEKLLSLHVINELYAQSQSLDGRESYFSSVLRVLDIKYDVSEEDLAKVPTKGPVIVVANHPFGAIDGIILGDILTRIRPDVRLLGNYLLHSVPEVRDWVIPVDPFGGPDASRANIAPLKSCMKWLNKGGVLATFPSGTVSHLQLRQARISDPPWHATIAALVRRCNATVVPVYFDGRNSLVFHLAGLVHQSLRTALLPSELLKRRETRLGVRIGRPIGAEKIARYPDDQTLTDYLRWKTYMLERRESPVRPRFVPRPASTVETTVEPIVDAVPPALLEAEVKRLPPETKLLEASDLQVFIAEARQIPTVLREIGRLREVTFRAVSEGTGTACDLDEFDQRYLHLFMWNKATREIVGSYRVGRADELLAKQGVPGLYTSTLFKFKAGFLERLGPTLELGRSFIRVEYQRKATSLALLWRGIGEYLVRNPHYKVLFGPVSISRDYHRTSRGLMMEFLQKQRGDESLSGLVKAKNPPREGLDRQERESLTSLVKDVDDVAHLVSEIEDDNRGMPVLLRHYLRLNARLLCFNVDPAFGECVDGLIVVDLRSADERMLKRFMGDDGYAFFSSVK